MTNLNPYLLGGGAAYHVTFFPDRFGKTLDPQRATLQGLAATISCATRKQKHELPLLKLARFGDQRSDEGSLRHNDNVLAITGVELDYDGEQMSFEEAVATVRKAGLSALLYTSPSFTCEKPRWRILCPASRELEPEQRAKLTGRVNGVFGGILGKESFTLRKRFIWRP